MLTYRTGAAGVPGVAAAMAEHLKTETDVPELQTKMAEYYGTGIAPTEAGKCAAAPREDMDPRIADLLGIEPGRGLSEKEVANILTGLRTDGEAIPGKQIQASTQDRTRIAYADFTLSAPKSFSVALAFAPTEAERAILDRCHRDAVNATMAHIASQIGLARKGRGGSKGYEQGHLAWIQFDHYTARPTLKLPVVENGIHTTQLVTVKVAGDPQRHTHVVVPNVVATDGGRVTSFFQDRIKDRVHEWGSIYQAYLGTNLRKHGVQWALDDDQRKSMNQRMGRITTIPRWTCDLFSKRTGDGEEAARAYAANHGADWDNLTPEAKAKFMKGGTAKARRSKQDDLADYQAWMRQAQDAGYEHRSVLRPDEKKDLAPARERLELAYATSLPVLEGEMERRSTFEGSLARVAAAKGLIEAGIADPAELNAITAAYRSEGVRQNGLMTTLIWGKAGESQFASFTTALHLDQENEAISLLSKAGQDKSAALTVKQIDAAIGRVSAAQGLDFTTEHGRRQRDMAIALGTGGRAGVGVGVAGAGKTALIAPLVDAWHAEGRETFGVTLAWRQSHALAEAGVGRRRRSKEKPRPDTREFVAAGVSNANAMALTGFIFRAKAGMLKLDEKSVVIIDEMSQVGTRQLLEVARLREQYNFQIVGLADDLQCQSIEAGATVQLLRRALGAEQVPELLDTIRQSKVRDRETALMFRNERADEALARKAEDGTLLVVPGGYRQAVEAAADVFMQRRAEGSGDPRYSIAISVPTNADAREVGAEIRKRRRDLGEVGPDVVSIRASDQAGTEYDLALAIGDRVRLFSRVRAAGRSFGDNGSVVEVLAIDPASGLTVRNEKGTEATLNWSQLRHRDTGKIMLTYGDALTIDARQGDTVSEHITVMPAGSAAVNAYKAYTTESRHRLRSWLITSEGEEMQEIISRRPLGDPRNLEADPAAVRRSVLANMARNLNRHPEKQLATEFLEKARAVKRGAIDSMQAAWHRIEVRQQKRKKTSSGRPKSAKAEARENLAKAAEKAAPAPKVPMPPKERRMSEVEIQAAFATQLERIGLRLPGPPIMDGEKHTVQVEGARGKRKSGWYRGFPDGRRHSVAGNSKSGEIIRWLPTSTSSTPLSPEELARQREAAKAERQAAAERQSQKEQATAAEAARIWKAAKPARPDHPYLQAKNIRPGILRQAKAGETAAMSDGKQIKIGGRLIVPMRDVDGQLWNIQMISNSGSKMFLPGRKKGLFTVIGKESDPNMPLPIVEGYATGDTLHNTTALRTVIAFDSGNLLPVATAIHAKHPDRKLIFAADNDHHLPGISLNLEAGADGKVNVLWRPGATGKASAGNTIEYRVAGAPDTDWKVGATAADPTITSVTVPGLLPGSRYDVRVFASDNKMPLPNVGVVKAKEAAAATGGAVAIPPFDPGDPGTDWNDFSAKHGRGFTAIEMARQGVPIAVNVPPAAPGLSPAQRTAHAVEQSSKPKKEL